jgi:hypothetical protein
MDFLALITLLRTFFLIKINKTLPLFRIFLTVTKLMSFPVEQCQATFLELRRTIGHFLTSRRPIFAIFTSRRTCGILLKISHRNT